MDEPRAPLGTPGLPEPALLAALVDRLVPPDDWPGGVEAGVLDYLERHAHDVDPGLWREVLAPGLAALAAEAEHRFGAAFEVLGPEQQAALLSAMEAGSPEGWPVSPALVLASLARLAAEGYYADPANGGNRGARSWEMIGYRPRPYARPGAGEPGPGGEQLALTPFGEMPERCDAVVIGAGAGGGVAAAVLAEAGLSVLLVERGEWLPYPEVGRDHLRNHRLSAYANNTGPPESGHPRTFWLDGAERVTAPHEQGYHNNAMTLGGGTRVFGAQAWRFHPLDFAMASHYGVPEGSSLADWPIAYEDLAPFYETVEWELGVAGDGSAHEGCRGARGAGYPMAPLPPGPEAEALRAAAARLGWQAGPPPLLINSVPWGGREACERCWRCVGFACPVGAKNGTHSTVIPRALATGRCRLVTEAMVERIETDARGRVTGVRVADLHGAAPARRRVLAGHVVVAAGAIETARLLLLSASEREPAGLGNGGDQVGRHLQGHCYAGAFGLFEEPFLPRLGPGPAVATLQFLHDNQGVLSGGMLANEFVPLPMSFWNSALPPELPRYGPAAKAAMRDGYLRTVHVMGPTEEIPVAGSRVRLSPTVRDRLGLPVAMLSGDVHPETRRTAQHQGQRAQEWLEEAGARRVWRGRAPGGLSAGQHQAGTARMGEDPATSVTAPDGRVHGHRNLWVADTSPHVTNGGVNPVLTAIALAWRTASRLAAGS